MSRKPLTLLAAACAALALTGCETTNARGKLRRSEAEGTNRRSLLASA